MSEAPQYYKITVKHEGVAKQILLYPGMAIGEIKAVLCSAFGISAPIVGLRDAAQDIHFPLTLLSRAPSYFSSRPVYELLLDEVDEDDEVYPIEAEPEYAPVRPSGRRSSVSQVFHLDDQQAHELMALFREAAPNGQLDRETFQYCFEVVLGEAKDPAAAQRMHQVLSKLFDIFDRDKNGTVDSVEFVTGLSVLAKGEGDDKIRATFEMYDEDGNGFISLSEMTKYLTSVFAVISQTSPEVFAAHNVTPEELAVATAKRCFSDADLNHDGKLDFDEFKAWYTSPEQASFNKMVDEANASQLPSIEVLRQATGLGNLDPNDVFAMFRRNAPNGVISRQVFTRCCSAFMPPGSESQSLVTQLFDIFDADGNGVVDFAELASGLSVLCGGSRDEKVRAAFDLFDLNGDGFISEDEMVKYLTSVFTVLYETSPETKASSGVSALELATVTTRQCFEDADVNHDGRLSFDEFKRWYSQSQGGADEYAPADESSFDAVCRLTNLRNYTVEDVSRLLFQGSRSGALDRSTFVRAFRVLREGTGLSPAEDAQTDAIVAQLFELFDEDGNGYVDHAEMASGLSVLCGGSREDRVRAAFSLYDTDGNGFISLDEMVRYLRSVYRLLYKMKPEIAEKMEDVGPDELALVTTQQAFAEADVDHDGQLSFEEFTRWYLSGHEASAVETVEGLLTIEDIRELTDLQSYDINILLDFFIDQSDADGFLSREAFFNCFAQLIDRNIKTNGLTDVPGAAEIGQLLSSLFDMFDTDRNGVVDISELSAGISVLSGGSRDDKVKAAFVLFDEDGDGFISLEEMTKYLASVFKVLYETSPDTRESMGVSPVALAAITAKQCFEDADTNHDGVISFEEFKAWYSKPSSAQITSAVEMPEITLAEVRELTNLGQHPVDTIFRVFAECADDQGSLSRPAFNGCFRALIGEPRSEADRLKTKVIIDRLFELFDTDGNGSVSYDEFASGLSILCGGTRDEKVRAAFSLFDLNGDGFITKDEMVCYLTSVFKILYETSPDTQTRLGVDPTELAVITSDQAFEEADLNDDGKLSFDEFQRWYAQPKQEQFNAVAATPITMEEIQNLTRLADLHVEDAVAIIESAANRQGLLDLDSFSECVMENFVLPNHQSLSLAGRQRAEVVVEALFRVFDQDHNGYVDHVELASGMSILCGGSREDKVKAAFSLYDVNGDGFISLEEMVSYLSSVFKLMFEVSPETQGEVGVTAEKLAAVTAQQAFEEADLNHDGRLSLDEFTRWYTSQKSGSASRARAAESYLSLQELRDLTGLGGMDVMEVFHTVALVADADGVLYRPEFESCMKQLIRSNGASNLSPEKTQSLVTQLFDIFDADGNGVVDYTELTSGLSVLCGGDRDDKVSAAFALFDVNGDGFISKDEMVTYLVSVFKLLYATQPDIEARIGVGPEELGVATALQAFEDADLNHDGKISFAEFKRWYQLGGGATMDSISNQVSTEVTLDVVRELTGLPQWDVTEVIELFASAASSNGLLDQAAFNQCFRRLVEVTGDPDHSKVEHLNSVLSGLFRIFDADGSGYVDFAELTSGLTVLCGGERDDKVKAAFELFDADGDGYITKEEMYTYLCSVFKVLYETNPATQARIDASVETLAQATTEQAFEDADTDGDGLISLAEFTAWYTSAGSPGAGVDPNEGALEVTPDIDMNQARWLLNLDKFSLGELLDTLVEAAPEGVLAKTAFMQAMLNLIRLGGNLTENSQLNRALELAEEIYDEFVGFDEDVGVDFANLTSGLSVLCTANMAAKVSFAFTIYDVDGDGLVSFEELVEYLASVFKVLFVTSPELRSQMDLDMSPDELAHSTASQAFAEAGLNLRTRIGKAEFSSFVEKGLGV